MAKQNNQGRALEYVYLYELEKAIKNVRNVEITHNSSYAAAKNAYDKVDDDIKSLFFNGAVVGVAKILELEPLILEKDNDVVRLYIQADSVGKDGDVRDIIIARQDIKWEIGISSKNEHFAVKHSRLSHKLDFGLKWFNIPCSEEYWKAIEPIFNMLKGGKVKGLTWNDLDDKESDVYYPLLSAFLVEVQKIYREHKDVMASAFVEYLVGKFDFYRVVSISRKKVTKVQPVNIRGMLNRPSKIKKSEIVLPIAKLPTRIINIDFKPDSKNTIEMFMDEGWSFSFRIHNAATKIEPSLKFDIQAIGLPVEVITIDCAW